MLDPVQQSIRSVFYGPASDARGQVVIVAVSGGQDSVALLYGLHTLSEELGIRLHVAHLNHGFRGESAEEDARFVESMAETLGVACTIESADVPAMAKRLHRGSQEAARLARHAFLSRTADEADARFIALGHTCDDHVETVLLNILRGTGTDGLRGLPAVTERIVRPLIHVSRLQTAEYCRMNGLAFREDESNRSLRYKRNRIRAELLPELETYYNRQVRDALARLSDIATGESEFLDELAQGVLDLAAVELTGRSVVLDGRVLQQSHRALQRRVIRLAIGTVRGSTQDVELQTVDSVLEALHRSSEACKGGKTELSIAGGATRVVVDGSCIRIERRDALKSAVPFRTEVEVPGKTRIGPLNLVIHATMRGVPAELPASPTGQVLAADADKLELPIIIRNRRAGDRLRPVGMTGTKKVQDVMVDMKVPAGNRDLVPILADASGVFWVVGCTFDERVRVIEATRRVLEFRIVQSEST